MIIPTKAVSVIVLALTVGTLAHAVGAFYTGSEFAQRREQLLAETRDGVTVVDASLFPSEFTYLTGVKSHTGKLIIVPEQVARRAPDPGLWQTTIYLPAKSPKSGVWDDPVLSAGEDTKTPTGIECSSPESSFFGDVIKIGLIADTIYLPFRPSAEDPTMLPGDIQFVQQVRAALPEMKIKNLLPVLDRIRWQKTAAQTDVMRKACNITTEAFKEAARAMKPGLFEYEIDGLISYIFRRSGADEAAFLIIGSGPNSCILHHMENDRKIGESEMVVVDIGAVYGQVSTDLTRTLPSSGTFTDEQKKIYEIVLKANKAAIDMVKPGVTLSQVHEAAMKVIADAGYERYFIHPACHPLNGGGSVNPLSHGITLPKGHDPYLMDMPLKPGSMFTIEPGIYIPEKSLGVRIEDDILVTADGHEVLTAYAPKEVADIERLMQEETVIIKK